MKKIVVLGLGNFGTALSQQLAITHDLVLAWTKETHVVADINNNHQNSSYLAGIKLSSKIKATDNLTDVSDFDLVVVALPAVALSPVYAELKPKTGSLLISATKGLDHTSNRTPLDCANDFYGNSCQYAVISGPGFAKDIARGLPAGLVAAAEDIATAQKVAMLFNGGNLRVYSSDDPLGVELGGIIKNVIAIAAGITDGLGLGDSARAGIITRGFAEMLRFSLALGAKSETLMGLSGMGDLILTATCDSSRNRTLGFRLGRGEKLADIVNTIGSVAEGAMATRLVLNIAAQKNIPMPIAEQVALILDEKIEARQILGNLMSRPAGGAEW